MGSLASPSPYSQIGGQRELLQMLAYEPLLILVFAAIAVVTGSFKVSAVFEHTRPLLYDIPLMRNLRLRTKNQPSLWAAIQM